MAGAEVEAIQNTGENWESITVGLVTAIAAHPNADRLRLVTVDNSEQGTFTVVCGAPNIEEGQFIAFAHEGAHLVDSRDGKRKKLRKSKIRGVESAGMVCSELELGISNDHEGIFVLNAQMVSEALLGKPLSAVLGEWILDITPTPNRPDHNSILGIAREVAALTGESVHEPDSFYKMDGPRVEDRISVSVEDTDLCSRYTAAVISGITIKPSPEWMQEALIASGQRPINNIVDVTNFVMLEMGQPLHAFDCEKISGNQITVRRAVPNEKIILLDGTNQQLDSNTLVIADSKRALAVAGIMGGSDSEVSNETKVILLEAATFLGSNNRRTATKMKKRTEASQRFEKNLNSELALNASKRAMKLLLETAGGTADIGHIDIHPGYNKKPRVTLPHDRITQIIGMEIDEKRVNRILSSLGFEIEFGQSEYLVSPPYWRSDIQIADDLIEEIVRIIGYNNLPSQPLDGPIPEPEKNILLEKRELLRDTLAGSGFREVINYSVNSELNSQLTPVTHDTEHPLKILNPMNAERTLLRTSLRSGLLQNFGLNIRQQQDPLGLFEIGKVFYPRNKELPEERLHLLLLYGGRFLPGIHVKDSRNLDFYDVKGVAEFIAGVLGITFSYDIPTSPDPILVNDITATINNSENAIGILGQLTLEVTDKFNISEPVYLLELDVTTISQLSSYNPKVHSLPRFPAVIEDLAVVTDEYVQAEKIESIILREPLVEKVNIFDIYRGDQIEQGKKSLAYTVSYRSPDRTLTERDITKARRSIVKELERELGARLRDTN